MTTTTTTTTSVTTDTAATDPITGIITETIETTETRITTPDPAAAASAAAPPASGGAFSYVAPANYVPPNLVAHNFDDDGFGPFSATPETVTIVDDPLVPGRKAVQIHYAGSNQDRNINLTFFYPPGIQLGQQIFFQGWVYFPAGLVTDPQAGPQRKLLYWQRLNQGATDPNFASVVTMFGNQFMIVNEHVPAAGPVVEIDDKPGFLPFGQWNKIKFQVRLNSTPTATDGLVRLWLNDVLISEQTAVTWSDPAWTSDPARQALATFLIGDQVNFTGTFDELRYWRDCAFSTEDIDPAYVPPALVQGATLLDTMQAPDATPVGAHVGDSGSEWMPQAPFTGAVQIVGNAVTTVDAGPASQSSTWTPPTPDYYEEAVFDFTDLVKRDRAGLNLRMDPNADTSYRGWFDQFSGTAGTGAAFIERHLDGVSTLLATADYPIIAGTKPVIRFSGLGASLALIADGVPLVTVTDPAPITTAGHPGFSFATSANATTAGQRITQITAAPMVAAASPAPVSTP